MKKLENDTRGIELTSESLEKSDKDMATISALDEFARKTKNTLIITGGFAVVLVIILI